MQVRPEQLGRQLARGLKPVYLVTGDEPLQFNESLDAIRAAAREQGFTERTVLDAETGFNWSRLAEAAASLSLFAERRLVELRLPSGRPGTEGGKALAAFAADAGGAGGDVVLLIGAGRIEARAKRSPWYRALEGAGAIVEVWPKERSALPAWLRERARSCGLDVSSEAIEELADRCEGNLAYGAQTIERLALLVSGGRIEIDDVLDGAAHGARFTSFDLVDATLAGNAARALAVLSGLATEGEAPPAIIGALAWQVRTVARIGRDLERGATVDDALRAFPAWRRRRGAVTAALRRSPAGEWSGRLAALAHLDAMSKGAAPGDEWDGLRRFVLDLCGVNTAPIGIEPNAPRGPAAAMRSAG